SRVVSEAHHQSARLQAVEGSGKGILPHRVVHHRHALAAGKRLDSFDKILLAVVDAVVGSVRLGERAFLLRTGGADYRGAERLQPLTRDQSDPARSRMEQNGFARLNL